MVGGLLKGYVKDNWRDNVSACLTLTVMGLLEINIRLFICKHLLAHFLCARQMTKARRMKKIQVAELLIGYWMRHIG